MVYVNIEVRSKKNGRWLAFEALAFRTGELMVAKIAELNFPNLTWRMRVRG